MENLSPWTSREAFLSASAKQPVVRDSGYFYAFDLLNLDGELLVDLPIERRREFLGENPFRSRRPAAPVAAIAVAIRTSS